MKIEVANIRLFTRKLCATFVNINLMENNRYVFALQKPYFYTAKTIFLHRKNGVFAMQLILENKEKSKFVQTD